MARPKSKDPKQHYGLRFRVSTLNRWAVWAKAHGVGVRTAIQEYIEAGPPSTGWTATKKESK